MKVSLKTRQKKLPEFMSDEEAIQFVENADLTQFDLSPLKTTRFEFEPKRTKVNMRFPVVVPEGQSIIPSSTATR